MVETHSEFQEWHEKHETLRPYGTYLKRAGIKKELLLNKLLPGQTPSLDELRRNPIVLDVALGSDNVGDQIIMHYCLPICEHALETQAFDHVSTHYYEPSIEDLGGRIKFVCGTNLVYTNMQDASQMAIPYDLKSFDNLCFLGVGMNDTRIDEPFSRYSKDLLSYLFSKHFIHSVRDQYTADRLHEIGIDNVVNTACPTMWKLTPEHCAEIPRTKGQAVLATVTDYASDPASDRFFLEALLEEYEHVYLWLQGAHDHDIALADIDTRRLDILQPTLENLNRILSDPHIDYVGTRLHAGIHALNHGRRALIIIVDNRARHIAEGTGLPCIERADLESGLSSWINGDAATEITLPTENIALWKNQFA